MDDGDVAVSDGDVVVDDGDVAVGDGDVVVVFVLVGDVEVVVTEGAWLAAAV